MASNENQILMKAGKLYNPNDPDIIAEQAATLDLLNQFNQKQKQDLLKQMFAEIGSQCYIQAPFYANWGGKHVHFGNGVYANFNLTLVDDGEIFVGDHVMFGPNVTLVTATHPISPDLRQHQFQYNKAVHIGENAWLGAGTTVLPGVSIGKNSVIGAGSLVTKNIPDNVVAVGNPCHILREISEQDR